MDTEIKGYELAEVDGQIERLRNRYSEARKTIENDGYLSQVGKKKRLAELKAEGDAEHAKLVDRRRAAIDKRRTALYRDAFNAGIAKAAPDSYRQAYWAAQEAADNKKLDTLRQQADRTQDVLLLRAVRQVAYDRGLDDLLNDAPAEVQVLLEFDRQLGVRAALGESRSTRLTRRLAQKITESGLR